MRWCRYLAAADHSELGPDFLPRRQLHTSSTISFTDDCWPGGSRFKSVCVTCPGVGTWP